MNPHETVLVVKDRTGREVGRIPATSARAAAYLDELARFHGEIKVNYVHDEAAGLIAAMFAPR